MGDFTLPPLGVENRSKMIEAMCAKRQFDEVTNPIVVKQLMNDLCHQVIRKERFPDMETQTEEFPITAPLSDLIEVFRAEEAVRKEIRRKEEEERRAILKAKREEERKKREE